MLIITRSIIKIIAFIFTFFLTIKYIIVKILFTILQPFSFKITQNLKNTIFILSSNKFLLNTNSLEKNYNQHKVSKSQCIQSIIDSVISLLLTALIVNYNESLIKFTLLISHHTHHSFFQLVFTNIPDYSVEIQNFSSIILIYMYILCGFLGFSTQIALSLDIINFFTFPTKLIYRFLAFFYKKLLKIFDKIIQFIKKDDEKWITCPYPSWLRNDSFKIVSIMLLIILIQILILTIFYYVWLVFVIFFLIHILKILQSFETIIMSIGQWICVFKGLKNRKEIKYDYIKIVEMFDPIIIVRIVKGDDILKKKLYQNMEIFCQGKYDLIRIFQKLSEEK